MEGVEIVITSGSAWCLNSAAFSCIRHESVRLYTYSRGLQMKLMNFQFLKLVWWGRPVVPNLFCPTGHLFYFGEHVGHKVKFFTSPPLLSPPFQQLWGLGERCKLPQRGLGRSPSRQRILEHSMAKSDRFDMLRQIFKHSKQHEIFRFSPRISYFHHNWHNGSYSTGQPCQNGKFYSFCTYIFKILQEVGGHFLRPGGPLLARGPQVGNHWGRPCWYSERGRGTWEKL